MTKRSLVSKNRNPPVPEKNSTYVFHQCTMRVKNEKCDELKSYLMEKGVSANIYYPLPLNEQKAFAEFIPENLELPITEMLCDKFLSLPSIRK